MRKQPRHGNTRIRSPSRPRFRNRETEENRQQPRNTETRFPPSPRMQDRRTGENQQRQGNTETRSLSRPRIQDRKTEENRGVTETRSPPRPRIMQDRKTEENQPGPPQPKSDRSTPVGSSLRISGSVPAEPDRSTPVRSMYVPKLSHLNGRSPRLELASTKYHWANLLAYNLKPVGTSLCSTDPTMIRNHGYYQVDGNLSSGFLGEGSRRGLIKEEENRVFDSQNSSFPHMNPTLQSNVDDYIYKDALLSSELLDGYGKTLVSKPSAIPPSVRGDYRPQDFVRPPSIVDSIVDKLDGTYCSLDLIVEKVDAAAYTSSHREDIRENRLLDNNHVREDKILDHNHGLHNYINRKSCTMEQGREYSGSQVGYGLNLDNVSMQLGENCGYKRDGDSVRPSIMVSIVEKVDGTLRVLDHNRPLHDQYLRTSRESYALEENGGSKRSRVRYGSEVNVRALHDHHFQESRAEHVMEQDIERSGSKRSHVQYGSEVNVRALHDQRFQESRAEHVKERDIEHSGSKRSHVRYGSEVNVCALHDQSRAEQVPEQDIEHLGSKRSHVRYGSEVNVHALHDQHHLQVEQDIEHSGPKRSHDRYGSEVNVRALHDQYFQESRAEHATEQDIEHSDSKRSHVRYGSEVTVRALHDQHHLQERRADNVIEQEIEHSASRRSHAGYGSEVSASVSHDQYHRVSREIHVMEQDIGDEGYRRSCFGYGSEVNVHALHDPYLHVSLSHSMEQDIEYASHRRSHFGYGSEVNLENGRSMQVEEDNGLKRDGGVGSHDQGLKRLPVSCHDECHDEFYEAEDRSHQQISAAAEELNIHCQSHEILKRERVLHSTVEKVDGTYSSLLDDVRESRVLDHDIPLHDQHIHANAIEQVGDDCGFGRDGGGLGSYKEGSKILPMSDHNEVLYGSEDRSQPLMAAEEELRILVQSKKTIKSGRVIDLRMITQKRKISHNQIASNETNLSNVDIERKETHGLLKYPLLGSARTTKERLARARNIKDRLSRPIKPSSTKERRARNIIDRLSRPIRPSSQAIKKRLGPAQNDHRSHPWIRNTKENKFPRRNLDDSHKVVHVQGSGDSLEVKVKTSKVEPLEQSDEQFEQLVHWAFFKFVKLLNENPAQQKKFTKGGGTSALKCGVCCSNSKDFVDTLSLAQHAFMCKMVEERAEHLGFHRALCVLMGWEYEPAPNGVWARLILPEAEALARKQDLIIWPPVVFVHNSSIANTNPNERMIVSTEELGVILRETGFGPRMSKVCRGKAANQSTMVVNFQGTFSGLQEAEKLHKLYAHKKQGRAEFEQISRRSNCISYKSRKADKVESLLYGYLGIAEDLDKLDFETKSLCFVKSKKEIQAIADAPG